MKCVERMRGGSNYFIEVRFLEDINDKINLGSQLKKVREHISGRTEFQADAKKVPCLRNRKASVVGTRGRVVKRGHLRGDREELLQTIVKDLGFYLSNIGSNSRILNRGVTLILKGSLWLLSEAKTRGHKGQFIMLF